MADTAAWQVLRGRYHLGDELSHAGAVVTRRGYDALLQREVAVTMPRRPVSGEPGRGDVGRDRVEAAREVLTDLDHPALPRVFDGGTGGLEGDPSYLVTDLFGGESLARRHGLRPLDPSRAAAVGADLAGLLAYLHARDLVHGALSPETVWIEDDGRVRVDGLSITRAPGDPQRRRASAADDVASLGRLLRTVTAQGAPAAGEWGALLDRMTADAVADRPAPDAVRARLQVLEAHTAPADALADAHTDEPATPHDPMPTVPATAVLSRPWRTRASAAVVTTAVALVGVGALLIATLSAPGTGGGSNPGDATVGVQPTPARPPATSPAPIALRPPTAGGPAQGDAPQAKGKAQEKKDKSKAEKGKGKEKGKEKPGDG